MSQIAKQIFCYFHYGGENVAHADGSHAYVGGTTDGLMIQSGITFDALVLNVCSRLHIDPDRKVYKFSLKYSKTDLVQLIDQVGVDNLIQFNDDFAHLYVSDASGEQVSTPRTAIVPSVGGSTSPMRPSCSESQNAEQCTSASVPLENTQCEVPPLACATWNDLILGQGQHFDSAQVFRECVYKYSIAKRFAYKKICSNSRYISYGCTIEGCTWKISATRDGLTDSYSLMTFNDQHTHSIPDQLNFKPKFSSKLMGDIYRKKINTSPLYSVRQLCKDSMSDNAITMTYHQAWRMKEKIRESIDGKAEESYMLIPWLCDRLTEALPGTIARWSCDADERFKQLFVAYGCSIRGFHAGCRPLIFIDGCHLSGPYNGTLLTATAVDANNGMYPVAYGVVTSENEEDWLWFLENLKIVVAGREIVVISDRNPSILLGVDNIFGAENHAHCYRHLQENFSAFIRKNADFKLQSRGKETAHKYLDEIAYARSMDEYKAALRKMRNFRPELYDWVLANGPEHWCNALFKKPRWDLLNSNVAESFNAWMVEARQLQIPKLMEVHREKLSQILLQKVNELEKWKQIVGPRIEDKIQKNQMEGQGLLASKISAFVMEVEDGHGRKVVVNFESNSCTCLEWQMTGIPCKHVCRAILLLNLNVYECVQLWSRREVQEKIYKEVMGGVPTSDMPKPTDIVSLSTKNQGSSSTSNGCPFVSLRPPRSKRPPGRPRNKQIESQFMNMKKVKCSRCHIPGHNRRKCTEPVT